MAAMRAVFTRLEEPKNDLSILQKLKLYDGKTLPGFTRQRQRARKTIREGMDGISPGTSGQDQ